MFDLYQPSEIARQIEAAGIAKARAPTSNLVVLSGLAGAFIAFGAAFYTATMTGVDPGYGPVRLLGGVSFSLGLILVVVSGAELFTGNALIVMALVDRKITSRQLARNWIIVYLGNSVGILLIAMLIYWTGLLDGAYGRTAANIAEAKLALAPAEVFSRAILCNALVCLAIWLSVAARTAAGKIITIILPTTAVVALGFEHAIANMYILSVGAAAGADAAFADAMFNIALATVGNIIGGAGGVALAYHFAFKPQV